jgi:transcriptional regulator with XRE-family HTH domain
MERFKRIGQKIKEAREQSKMTQNELGKLLGYTSVAITNYEKGKRKISIDDLEKIAQVTGKPLAFFLGDDITKSEPPLNIIKNIKQNLENALNLTYVPVLQSLDDSEKWMAKENINKYIAFTKDFVPKESFIVKVADSSFEEEGILKGDFVVIDPNTIETSGPVLARKDDNPYVTWADTARKQNASILGKVSISFRKYEP